MFFCSYDNQKGFSALGIFIAGLAVIIIMGSTGFFKVPKSPTGEENVTYTVSDYQSSNSKGLQMTKINFSTPTPIPPTPAPTSLPIPSSTPIPTPSSISTPTPTPFSTPTPTPTKPLEL